LKTEAVWRVYVKPKGNGYKLEFDLYWSNAIQGENNTYNKNMRNDIEQYIWADIKKRENA
jgi:hypothetical protein